VRHIFCRTLHQTDIVFIAARASALPAERLPNSARTHRSQDPVLFSSRPSRPDIKSPRRNLGGILSCRICPRRLRIACRLCNARRSSKFARSLVPEYRPPARRCQKVREVFSRPGILERFLAPSEGANCVRNTWVSMCHSTEMTTKV
jgi:hypothetical protein